MVTTDEDAGSPTADAEETTKLYLAGWDDRFWAWLIDVILVGAVLSAFGEVAGMFTLVTGSLSVTAPWVGFNGLGLWLYWTALEGYQGQSAGKMVMDIAVVDEAGGDIDWVAAAVESFGKAFLLPIDALVGWLAMEGEYVRLFNRLSSTIVVEVGEDETVPEGVEYVPPSD